MTPRCLSLVALLSLGCGARTVADDYRDAGRPDGPAPPDAPIFPDRELPTCPPGLARCGDGCVSLEADPAHCGGCGLSCGPGGMCVGGSCVSVSCASPREFCDGECVNLQSDPAHCGDCGRACGPGELCSGGFCASAACPPPLARCGGDCFDLRADPTNCGACGARCLPGRSCRDGACVETLDCPSGLTRCGRDCVDLGRDPRNCGACARGCSAREQCDLGRCAPAPALPSLRIDALLTSGCRVAEHERITGDDRGGIAFAGSRVFYTGDTATVGFDANSLAAVATAPQRLDGIFGELSRGLPFTLASNTTPFGESTSIVDALLQVSADGTPGRTAIPLRTTAFLDRNVNEVGVFAGPLRVVLTQGPRAWIIDGTMSLASPAVTVVSIPPVGAHAPCESWAFWGVAELIDGQIWLAYVRDPRAIVRQNLRTGAIEEVATFPGEGLGDMCSFTVAPALGRWYFHHESPSFARRDFGETIGYCDARFTLR
jgi:hypothetical protein